MIPSDFAVVKLERDEKRQWTIIGQAGDVPGGTRPMEIWPIVRRIDRWVDEKGVEQSRVVDVPRTRASGFIDNDERFAYIRMNRFKRDGTGDRVEVRDEHLVELS